MRLVERVRRALSGSISSYSVSPSRKKPGSRSASNAGDGAILKSTVEPGLLVVTAVQRLIYRWAKRAEETLGAQTVEESIRRRRETAQSGSRPSSVASDG